MSTTAQVRAVFDDHILVDDDIIAVTEMIYNYVPLDEQESDFAKLKYKNKINFLTYQITRGEELKISNCVTYTYSIKFDYYLEADKKGASEHSVISFLELISNKTRVIGGGDLMDTVDGYLTNPNPITINTPIIEGKKCVQGTLTLTAQKFASF